MNNDNFWYLSDIFLEKKKQLAKIEIHKDKTKKYVIDSLNWILVPYNERMKEWMVHTWINISYSDILLILWLNINSFYSKTSLDLWWGFSGLPFLLNWIKTNTIIVDPIFEYNINNQIQYNIDIINSQIIIRNNLLRNKQKIFSSNKQKIEFGQIKSQIDEFNKISYEILSYLYKWMELWESNFKSMLSESWIKIWLNNVNLNASSWNSIEWITNNLVDIIFINHVITKSTVNPLSILDEAGKLLKRGWCIYILENDIIEFNKYIKIDNYNFHFKYDWNKTIVVLVKK